MDKEKLYTIGEVSRLCNISAKTLRFYDKIGMIVPDKVSESGYRYYSADTILNIPVVKYYKQMGFKLEEMQQLVNGDDFQEVQTSCKEKIDELWRQVREIQDSYVSVKDWYELLQEAKAVRYNRNQEVSVRYIPGKTMCCLEQDFSYEYADSVINIPWVNYLDEIENEITGPVILGFSSWKEKMEGKSTRATIMQFPVHALKRGSNQTEYGGCMAVTLYHVGSHETMGESYRKMEQWMQEHEIRSADRCYERYVVDYWTTRNPNAFVTELIIPMEQD